jgi:hypothetical protein
MVSCMVGSDCHKTTVPIHERLQDGILITLIRDSTRAYLRDPKRYSCESPTSQPDPVHAIAHFVLLISRRVLPSHPTTKQWKRSFLLYYNCLDATNIPPNHCSATALRRFSWTTVGIPTFFGYVPKRIYAERAGWLGDYVRMKCASVLFVHLPQPLSQTHSAMRCYHVPQRHLQWMCSLPGLGKYWLV